MSDNDFPLANLTLADLDLTRDCSTTGSALALWAELDTLPYESLISMIRGNYDGNLTASDADIVDWYTSTNDNLTDIQGRLIASCLGPFCRDLEWEGNPDLAGIGVLSAYSIQVGITSFFILAALFYQLVLKQPPRRLSVAIIADRPFFTALHSALGIFWDTALLFALSVAIASIILTFTERTHYTQAFSALSTVLVTPPLIALWPFYVPACSRPLPRRIALFILCCVTFAMGTRYVAGTSFPESPFEVYCFQFKKEPAAQHARYCVLSATAYLGLGVVAWVAYHWNMFRDWRVLRHATAWKHRHRYGGGMLVDSLFIIFVGLVPFVFMWTTLAIFIMLRREIADIAGASIQEREWGFGQILALVTWVPTALDFIVVWWSTCCPLCFGSWEDIQLTCCRCKRGPRLAATRWPGHPR